MGYRILMRTSIKMKKNNIQIRIVFINLGSQINYSFSMANAISKLVDLFFVLAIPPHLTEYKNNPVHLLDNSINVQTYKMFRRRNPRNIRRLWQIFQAVRKFKPEIIHIHSACYPLELILIFAFKIIMFKKIKIIFTLHDPKFHAGAKEGNFQYLFSRIQLCLVDHVILLGQFQLELFNKSTFSMIRPSATILPYGIIKFYKKKNAQNIIKQQNRVLFFGRIQKYKGIEYFVEAAQMVKKRIKNVKFVIAGAGDYFVNIEKKITDRSLFEVRNYHIPEDELAELMQGCEIVVLPYIEATQSGPLLVAYSFGKPVIATKVGSFPEYIDDGKTGRLVPKADSEMLAETIIGLLSDSELLKSMKKNIDKFIKEKLDWDRISAMQLEKYEEILRA